ncbi:MAG: acyltransferase [Clostridia bacterium]|nr:acyltransferase [Clostridia bacterium]
MERVLLKERNYGIDLLRLVLMFYVIILHVLGQGGAVGNPSNLDAKYYWLVMFLETIAYCAVDGFALMSGYVGYKEENNRLRLSHYLNIWLQVVFYGLVITAVFCFILPQEIGLTKFIKAFFPVTLVSYWYFTAYTALFFVAPLINVAVQKTNNATLKKSAVFLLVLFSAYASAARMFGDTFNLHYGYSFVWIALMYYIGAVMKKTGLFSGITAVKGIVAALILAILRELWLIHGWDVVPPFLHKFNVRYYLSYNSPAIVAIAIIHVVLFAKLRLPSKMVKIVKFAAPGAFAVYIINVQYYVWNYVMKGNFAFLAKSPLYEALLVIIGFALLFVAVSVTADHFRQVLFRAVRLNKLTVFIENRVNLILDRLVRD